MLSRVAESIYWLSRYIERSENVARFIDANDHLTLGEVRPHGQSWTPLLDTTASRPQFEQLGQKPNRENVIRFLAFERSNPNSIFSCVERARENARTIREVISSVVWEQLNKFHFLVHAHSEDPDALDQPHTFCEHVRLTSHLLVGAMDDTMSHDDAWHFARLGRMLERADQTSRLLDVQGDSLLPAGEGAGAPPDVIRWSALLRSASALESYRRLHGKIAPPQVAHFLMLDREFPRSMHSSILRALESMRVITGSNAGTYRYHSEQWLGRLCSDLDYAEIGDVLAGGLHSMIDSFQTRLNEVGNEIHRDFFSLNRAAVSQTPVLVH